MLTLTVQELENIAGFIKEKYGVNLAAKSTLIESRLGCHLQTKGFQSYSAYFEYVQNDPTGVEMANLINRLTTNHTFFMRENDLFQVFSRDALPWALSLPGGEDLRVWCAGCSTGEEPYGLSIYILEYIAARRFPETSPDTAILASDISEKALTIASKGIYLHESLSAMPSEWIAKYFIDLGNGAYQTTPGLRSNVAFKKINLLDPFIISKPYHAIFCRNVMIYFDTDTRASLINRFYDVMAPGAYLFIGHSESLTNIKHGFTYIQPSVYRKPLA